ncbi:DUF2920 family protein [Lysinibacillus sp. NPDC097287]|uniref:DUF2920 family protein n=1 Tax=Lysinibacillus sp. NPDC097287 TaxID=3364144 RepID=UPI00381F0E33
MAINESINIPAHPNIYNGYNNRNLRIDFSIPEAGTNEDTGIFVFVPGFGGHIDSNIYKKMRARFADKYNTVTVQCDYFGSRFMQDTDYFRYNLNNFESLLTKEDVANLKENPSNFLTVVSQYEITVPVVAIVDETVNEFVDMSYMQAIDVVTAIEAVKIILQENQLMFNDTRVIGYGQSQGAYLLHLANKLAPHLFERIIDNAAWVQPAYLNSNRYLYIKYGQTTISMEFDYIAKNLLKDKKSLSLHNIYKDFNNGAYIYSCLGTTDNLVEVQDKQHAFNNLRYVNFEVIDQSKVDGVIFKSTNHGLDANFLELVEYALVKMPKHKNLNKQQVNYIVESSLTQIRVDYSNGLPIFSLM